MKMENQLLHNNWKVIENKTDSQVWEYSTSYDYESGGETYTAEIDATLEMNR